MKKTIFLFTVLILSGLFYFPVFGAEIGLFSKTKEVGLEQFRIDVILDTQNENLNAVEGTLIFPQNLLAFSRFTLGDSIINFWLQKPGLESGGEIIFSGIIPGGYYGKGKIFSVVFKALEQGDVSFELAGLKVLLNDGQGTAKNLNDSRYTMTIKRGAETGLIQLENGDDFEPPESFSVHLAKDKDIFEGKWFIVFETQDKKSGIDHFEVAERKPGFLISGKPSGFEWVFTESPYVLKNQELKSDVYVKAVDGTGNERIEFLAAPGAIGWYKNYFVWIIILVVAVFICQIVKKIYGKRKTRK